MKKGRFEEKLVEKLGNYETNLDLETAWEALELRRNKPKRRKLPFLWLLFGILAFGIGTLVKNKAQVSTASQNMNPQYTSEIKNSISSTPSVLFKETTTKTIDQLKGTGF